MKHFTDFLYLYKLHMSGFYLWSLLIWLFCWFVCYTVGKSTIWIGLHHAFFHFIICLGDEMCIYYDILINFTSFPSQEYAVFPQK